MEQAIVSPDPSEPVASYQPDNHPPEGVKISIVPPDHVDHVWGQVMPLLKSATDHSSGRYTVGSVYELIAGGHCHLWIGFELGIPGPLEGHHDGAVPRRDVLPGGRLKIIGAATSVFTIYPGGRWLTAQFLGSSDMERCRDFLPIFERWGRDNECKGVEFSGRLGWGRALRKDGYEEFHRFFQKEL